jgi:hypothetical protein
VNRKLRKTTIDLFLILFVLSAMDYCMTFEMLGTGKVIEANPVMAFILEHCGFWTGLIIKQLMILPLLIVVYRAQKYDWVLWPCVALYLGVVVWHFFVLSCI